MRILAAAAHPDDIEFMMAGTLLRLKDAGHEIHLWNLANGSCGSSSLNADQIAEIRWAEAQRSAACAGGFAHPPLFADMEIFYDKASLARVASVLRRIRPDVILTQAPQDYMEDHQNTVRLVVGAAFTRAMPNFSPDPPCPPYDAALAVYHALPHGLRDALRQPVQSDFFVDVSGVLPRKREMLACHASQKQWLDETQGMDAYLDEMENLSAKVGRQSGRFPFAEGWRRHSHLGFGPEDFDPVFDTLCR